jgi:hypothetical protein
MKKVVSIPSLVIALSAASGCAPIEQSAKSSDDVEYCRMESSIGSHVKDEHCDPNSMGQNGNPGRDPNGIFGEILAEQMDRSSHSLPEPRCRPR